jgi:hypothetical protein
MKKAILLFGIFNLMLLFAMSSFATTKIWIGAISSDWSYGNNWGGTAPDLDDNIMIPSVASGIYPVITKSVLLGSGTILINSNNGSVASLTISTGGSLVTSGLISVSANGKFLMNGISASLNGITSSGIIEMQGGTITSTGYITINSGTLIQSAGLIHLASDTESNPTDNLAIYGGTVSQSGGTLYVKDFKPFAGSFNQSGSTALLKIFHDWGPGSGHTFNSLKGTVQFSGASSLSATFVNTNTRFNDVIVDASINPGFDNDANSMVKISGNLTNYNSKLNNSNNVAFIFDGSENQIVTSKSASFFNKLTVDKPGGFVMLASGITVAGTLTMLSGNIKTGSNTLTLGTSNTNRGTLIYTSGIIITGSSGSFKRWFSNDTTSNILFPVGTSLNNNTITLSFTVKPSAGGSLTAKFVSLDPESSSHISIDDAGYSLDVEENTIGYWQIDAANGLTGGKYSISLRRQSFNNAGTEIENHPHLRILKKSTPEKNWTYTFVYSKLK